MQTDGCSLCMPDTAGAADVDLRAATRWSRPTGRHDVAAGPEACGTAPAGAMSVQTASFIVCDVIASSHRLMTTGAACILGAVADASRTVCERRVAAAALAAAASPGAVAAPSTRADADSCAGAPRLAQPQQLLGRYIVARQKPTLWVDRSCARSGSVYVSWLPCPRPSACVFYRCTADSHCSICAHRAQM